MNTEMWNDSRGLSGNSSILLTSRANAVYAAHLQNTVICSKEEGSLKVTGKFCPCSWWLVPVRQVVSPLWAEDKIWADEWVSVFRLLCPQSPFGQRGLRVSNSGLPCVILFEGRILWPKRCLKPQCETSVPNDGHSSSANADTAGRLG